MQHRSATDVMCETTCKLFRCSEKFLLIRQQRGKKKILCRMVEGDECIGYKCKYAAYFFRPSAMDIPTGICSQKVKKQKPYCKQKDFKKDMYEDPLKYRKMLDKKTRKILKIKDFY